LRDVVLDVVAKGLDAKDAIVVVKAFKLVMVLLVIGKVHLRVVDDFVGHRRHAGDDLEAVPAQYDVAEMRLLRKHHGPGREALVVHRLWVEDRRRGPAAQLACNTHALSICQDVCSRALYLTGCAQAVHFAAVGLIAAPTS